MKLSLIVPIYNEERYLRKVIPFLLKATLPLETEWILIDDKSTDGSLKIIEELSLTYPMTIIRQPVNQGKGAAVIRGFHAATGDIIMIQDADFEYHPRYIPALLEPIMKDEADVVYGSRFKKNAAQVHRTYHYFVNRFLTFLSNLFSGIYLIDMETCYKVFRADLGKVHARIQELPIGYYPRTQLHERRFFGKMG